MPPPNPESDLKRRARRRLIGAVALMLLAVIVLPLLLEDEPPPASSLHVKMAEAPVATATSDTAPIEAAPPAQSLSPPPAPPPEADTTVHPDMPVEPATAPPPAVAPKAAPKPEPKPPVSKPAVKPPVPPKSVVAKPKPAQAAAFVVQLAALSDASKADALEARAHKLGLAAYTDKRGNLTRVRVGPFASREAAVAAAVKLAEAGLAGQVVTQ